MCMVITLSAYRCLLRIAEVLDSRGSPVSKIERCRQENQYILSGFQFADAVCVCLRSISPRKLQLARFPGISLLYSL